MKKCKRLLCLLLALVIVAGLTVTAFAAEEETGNAGPASNVQLLSGVNGLPDAPENQYPVSWNKTAAESRQFVSSYVVQHFYEDKDEGTKWDYHFFHNSELFNMHFEGNAINAFCTDADTSAKTANYRRLNLEDSTYHATGSEGKVRAIVLNSVARLSVDQIQANAQASGFNVTNLNRNEALTAAQLAVWKTTHGEKYEIEHFYLGDVYDPDSGLSWMKGDVEELRQYCVDTTVMDEKPTESTGSNIQNLFNYYQSLSAVDPMVKAASEKSLTDTYTTKKFNSDDTVTVTAYITVNATVRGQDDLYLYASMSGQNLGIKLQPGVEKYWFQFAPVADYQVEDVDVVINGMQYGDDVYMFEAEGGRRASQPMAGYDNSPMMVYGRMRIPNDEMVLNIYKTTPGEENARIPLANIPFHVYWVGTMDAYTSGELDIGRKPTAEDVAKFATESNFIATLTTDNNGFATTKLENEGVYMVIEEKVSAIQKVVEPFFITLPYPMEDGSVTRILNVHPKNDVIKEDVDVEKDVTKLDNDHDTFDVGVEHTWIIRSSIPTALAEAQLYKITDTLDYRLTYVGVSEVAVVSTHVEGDGEDAKEVEDKLTLTEGEDYILTYAKGTDDAGNSIDQFNVSLTASGMKKAAAHGGEIRVYFKAKINQNATVATEIPNQAHVDYTNSVGTQYEDDSDRPEVHTGGLKLHKVDMDSREPLAGATFKLARKARSTDKNSVAVPVGEESVYVVYVDFYATEDMSGEKVNEVTTDENGIALFYGLAYSEGVQNTEYYLVETKAPDGYGMLRSAIPVTIDGISHLDDNAETVDIVEGGSVTVENKAGSQLPETGGEGVMQLYVLGSIFCLAAAALLLNKKRVYNR